MRNGGGEGRSSWGPVARLVLILAAAGSIALLADVRFTRTVSPDELRAERGRAFYMRLWNASSSDADPGTSSTLEVLEDGRPLPFPHTFHDDIRSLGDGRYSHWLNGVLLSASDSTDPRTNGRLYQLRYSYDMTRFLALLPLLLLIDRAWWRERLRRAAARPAVMTALLLGVALVVRATIFAEEADGSFQGNLIKGAPYSDARGWETHAESLSQGDFEWLAASGWTARRPLYYVVLGSIYAWTGPSVSVAQVLNLLFGALAVAFVFDAVRRVAPLPVAVVAALGLAMARCGLLAQLLTMSEPLGDLCTAVSVWALVLGIAPEGVASATPRLGWLCVAGAFLGLSNLARPLTLLAAGALPLALLFAPRGWSRRSRFAAGGALVLGVVLTVGPWVAVQRVRHGIWTISENTAEMFYAATSREHDGVWNGTMSGLVPMYPLKERVSFYAAATRENLREDFGWYVGHTVRNLLNAIAHSTHRGLPERVLLCVAFMALAGRIPRRGRMAVGTFVALLAPQWLLWPVGALWALARRGPMAIFATYHLSTWVAMGIVNVAYDHRFAHSVEWSGAALSAWTVWQILATACGTPAAAPVTGWECGKRALRLAGVVAAVAVLGGAVIAVASSPVKGAPPIAGDARAKWIERALEGPGQEAYRPFAARLHLAAERMRTDYRVDLGKDDPLAGADAVTRARDYPVVLWMHRNGLNAVFPGSLPPMPDDSLLVFVGVPGIQGPTSDPQSVLEVVAVGLPDGRMIYPDPALVPAHVAHITSAVR